MSPLVKGGFRGICLLLKYNPHLKTKARSLRSGLTDAEQRLWNRLRRKQILGVQFYRQKPIGNYIVDFYAPSAQLVVELDGAQHAEPAQAKYDERRSQYLQQQALRVLRFDDRQVLLETDAVVQEIYVALNDTQHKKNPS
jgi:very-short-patch-repair endonuclease